MKLKKTSCRALLVSLTLALPAAAETPSKEASSSPKAVARALDPAEIDKAVDPCQDFFRYTCGTWLKSNPIPAEYPLWGRFNELQDKNLEDLRGILEAAAAKPGADPVRRVIGDYYAACMDESRAEREGLSPVQPTLDRVAALKSPAEAVIEAGRLHREGVPALFSFESAQDARDATEIIAEVDQGGLGLPDRDYYTKDDDKSKRLRSQYVDYLAKLFALAGDAGMTAEDEAKRVLAFETKLATSMQTKVERRDPERLYNRKKLAELRELAPAVP